MLDATRSMTIDRLSYGPAGVGRLDGKAIFVPETAPGDVVEVRIEEEKKGYARGRVTALLTASPFRREPPCPYVQRCGGCPWQHLTYEEQLRSKETLVQEQLRRIGGLAEVPLLPILPSPREWRYRQRIRLHVEQNTRLGFSPSRSHAVVEIQDCLIAWEGVAAHLQLAREWVAALRTPVAQLELAVNEGAVKDGGEQEEPNVVILGEARGPLHSTDEAACERFLAAHLQCVGLMLSGREWQRTWGDTSLTFSSEESVLTARDGAFTQVNPAANRVLTASLLQLCAVHDRQRVIELYCGAGNFSVALARRARGLIGIEQNSAAIAAARANAQRAGLPNARFVHDSALAGVQQLLKSCVQCDVIVLDPPRTGAAEVIDVLPQLGASMIAYVSCDPATLARDLRRLQHHGYRLQAVQPIDMFPQTYHVETIAVSVLT
ncbi:MAG: 23S rRNA (uracil(1939)-C(5))-methyltransferase RlmD [Deltaproteobacteria bacterium]|nr:23S rRNA (uracil(1939)-C(5))-methyltransferase RlmD [Deltaproteobacteria bacterium]